MGRNTAAEGTTQNVTKGKGKARQVVQKLPAREPKEALESVLVGDMVVRHLTKH